MKIEGGFFGSIASWVALVLGLIALGIFFMVAFTERFRALPEGQEGVSETGDHVVVGATTDSQPVTEGRLAPTETGSDHSEGLSGDVEDRPSERRSD